jgi:hypothetical protein
VKSEKLKVWEITFSSVCIHDTVEVAATATGIFSPIYYILCTLTSGKIKTIHDFILRYRNNRLAPKLQRTYFRLEQLAETGAIGFYKNTTGRAT